MAKKETKKKTVIKKDTEKKAPKKTPGKYAEKECGAVPVVKTGGRRRCYFCKTERKITGKRYYNVGGAQKPIYQMECGHFDHD
jgi:hypothetical protein